MRTCNKCGEQEVPTGATFCPSCGQSMATTTPAAREPESDIRSDVASLGLSSVPLPQILGLAGSAILFVGVFMPIISLPIVGSMNYFQNGRGDGVIILLIAILSGFLSLGKRYRFLLYTGGGSLIILALTFIFFQVRMSQAQAEMKKSMGNNPFAGLGDAMMNSVQISWGWAVLILGAVLLIAAALIKREESVDGDVPETPSSIFRSISDKHIFASIGVIFVSWLGLIAYDFIGGQSATPVANAPSINNSFQTKRSSTTTTSTAASTSPEELAYLANVSVSKVEVAKTILQEPGVFGELKNNGDRTLDQVEITIYLLNTQGNPVAEKKYAPVNESAQNFGMSDTSALKPKYSRKFGYDAKEAPSDWAKKVRVEVTKVAFAK
ncbi:MAG: hypothetical protein ABIO54_04175 [Pyrinomonadaceae bacterium]